MSKAKPLPSQEELKNLFDYHPDGYLIWKVSTAPQIKVGQIVGTTNKKTLYRRTTINYTFYLVHRLIYCWHYGEIPNDYLIDHIDGDKSNNRIENLRIATKSQNQQNRKAYKNNKLGIKGVSWNHNHKKYHVHITINNKIISLGSHSTLEEAIQARKEGEKKYHPEFGVITE